MRSSTSRSSQRLAHQAEGAVLEIAQAAMDQLGGGRGGAGGEIVLLDQQHAQAAAGGVAGESGSVDAAADDGEVVVGHGLLIRFVPRRMGGLCGTLKNRTRVKAAFRPQNPPAIAKSPRLAISSLRHTRRSRAFNLGLHSKRQCPPPACSSSKAIRRRPWPNTSRPAEPRRSKGYSDLLRELLPGAIVDICYPGDPAATLPDGEALEGYDGIAITGSSLHVYDGGPEVMRQIDLVRAALGTGTPLFGSCWGLQVITAAAGGSVRKNPKGREIGFGRGIRLTEAGRKHPMYVGKLDVFNAPTVHLDEVEALPPGTTVLATNADVGRAERRDPHQRLGRLGRAVSSGISAARVRGHRAPHRHAADRGRLLRRRSRHQDLCAGPRHARQRSRIASGCRGGTASARTCSTRSCASARSRTGSNSRCCRRGSSGDEARWIFPATPCRRHRRHRRARHRGRRRAARGRRALHACLMCTKRRRSAFPIAAIRM